MKRLSLDFSTIVFVAAVHAMGGIGFGVWLAQRLPVSRRRTVALTLMAVGATLHVPMRRAVLRGKQHDGNEVGLGTQ